MANSKPLVSVIMNCYNSDKYLREAIDSVIAQTYENWEIIFWDNQSQDKSAEIARSYEDPKIKYFYAPVFMPLYGARNLAVEKARGEYISFLDCDDKWYPDKLKMQLSLLQNKNYSFCYSNYHNLINGALTKAHSKCQPSGDIFKYQLANYSIGILTVMLKKEAWNQMVEKFDPSYTYPGDYDFFVRFLHDNSAVYIFDCLCMYRLDNSDSVSNTKELKNIAEMKHAINKLEQIYSKEELGDDFKMIKAKRNLKEGLYFIKIQSYNEARRVLRPYRFYRYKNFILYFLTFWNRKLLDFVFGRIFSI